MAKKLSYTDLSDSKCRVCKKPLKKNLVNKNPDAHHCYICNLVVNGKTKKKFNVKEKQSQQIRKYSFS